MNGRIYEPRLGRMLSPDPVTQAPENGQNYNRYSYAYNNPLKYTDPSGYEVEKKRVLEEVTVYAERIYSEPFVGNQVALAFAGGDSPQTSTGDNVERAGQPVSDIQTAGGIDCSETPEKCTAAETNGSDQLVDFLKWVNNQWNENKTCRNDCLTENFGEVYLVAADLFDLTAIGIISELFTEIGVNITTEYIEEPVLRELHDELAATRRKAILRRRAITLIRAGNGIFTLVGASAALVQGTAISYCEVRCNYN